MKITDRINNIEGVEKSFCKNGELTVYYDVEVSLFTINVRIQKILADIRLMGSVRIIKLLSTEKGTFN